MQIIFYKVRVHFILMNKIFLSTNNIFEGKNEWNYGYLNKVKIKLLFINNLLNY